MRISDWSSDVCSSDLRVGHDLQLAFGQLGRQRGLQRQLADLLGQVDGMAVRHRAERLAAAAELRRADTAVAGAAAALLLDDLAGRTRNLTIGLGLVRALLALGPLPDPVALQQV